MQSREDNQRAEQDATFRCQALFLAEYRVLCLKYGMGLLAGFSDDPKEKYEPEAILYLPSERQDVEAILKAIEAIELE